jgi:hypothetical protein
VADRAYLNSGGYVETGGEGPRDGLLLYIHATRLLNGTHSRRIRRGVLGDPGAIHGVFHRWNREYFSKLLLLGCTFSGSEPSP